MAPVIAGCVAMSEMYGEMTLWDLAIVNDALAVQAENRRRAAQ